MKKALFLLLFLSVGQIFFPCRAEIYSFVKGKIQRNDTSYVVIHHECTDEEVKPYSDVATLSFKANAETYELKLQNPGVGHGNTLQYSCLENSTDRGARWATVHRVGKSGHNRNNLTHAHAEIGRLSWYAGTDLRVSKVKKKQKQEQSPHSPELWHFLPFIVRILSPQQM